MEIKKYVYVCVDEKEVDRTFGMEVYDNKKDAEFFCKSMRSTSRDNDEWILIEKEVHGY